MTVTTGQDVADFLGQGEDTAFLALAEQSVAVITAMARSYTRDRGFDEDGTPAEAVAAVILTATARLMSNREQLPSDTTAGPFSKRTYAGFNGWSLAETFVLNRYRKRAL